MASIYDTYDYNNGAGAYSFTTKSRKLSYQPVRTNNFRFLADFSNTELLRVDTKDTLRDAGTAQEIIDFSVVKFNPPHFTQDEIAVKRGNSTVYYASVPTFDADDLVINDFAGADGKSILLAWQALSYDVVNDIVPTSEKYKINATVVEYLPDGTYLRHWVLYGCWVKGISEDGWDNESASKKTVTASIRYDRAIPYQDVDALPDYFNY